MPPPPYVVTDNQDSWFEHFDLVFIDPPHTGYSLTASEDARKKMLSVDGDVEALARVLSQALRDPDTLRRMGEAARRRMESWSPRENAEAIVQAVETAIAGRHPRAGA